MAGQVLHRSGSGVGGDIKLFLKRGILDLRKCRLGIAGEIIGKTAKAGLAIFDIAFRQRQLQVRLDLRRSGRHVFGIFDKGLHPRGRVGIGPRDIDIGVQRTDIISRILVRKVGVFQPEQLALHYIDQIVALEQLGLAQIRRINRLRVRYRLLANGDHFLQTLRAPVRQLAVKFMLALINGEGRIDRKIAVQEAGEITAPHAAAVDCHRSDRLILDLLATGDGQGRQRYRQHQIANLHFCLPGEYSIRLLPLPQTAQPGAAWPALFDEPLLAKSSGARMK